MDKNVNNNKIDDNLLQYDIVIIGAGISGLTLAERYASIGKKVLIVEKRNHIGGNCFDFINEHGILVATYGPHYFHTNDEEVWKYVNKFSEWNPYEHRAISHVNGKKVPIPINQTTLNILFDAGIKNEKDAEDWFASHRVGIPDPKNAKDAVIARMGTELYELLFEGYTTKQWGMTPESLGPEVTNRIPFRYNNYNRYFTDIFQGMPKFGYTKFFETMIKNANISIVYNTDWENIKEKIIPKEKLFFTGRIDQYFEEQFGKLQYRSLRFEFETLDQEYFQEYAQENYPSVEIPYTRIVEYKHATKQKHPKTTISKEYATWEGEPYYPVLSEPNKLIYEKYQAMVKDLEKQGVFFVGRLANYKYFNMDQAFKNSLDIFLKLENKGKL